MIRIAILSIAALMGIAMMVLVGMTYGCEGCDYQTFAAIGPAILGGDPIYQPWQAEPYLLIDAARGQGWVYPPPAAVLMVPVQWIPELAWRVLNIGSVVIVVWLMLRDQVRWSPLVAMAVVTLFPPTWIAWSNGQVTPLLAAGLGAAYLYPRWAWVIAAIGGAIKLFPLVLLAWVLRERGWRDVALAIGAFALLTVLTLPITGLDAWPAFMVAMRNGAPNCSYAPIDSIQCSIGPLIGAGPAQLIAFGIAGLLTLSSLIVPSRSLAFLLLTIAVPAASPDLNRPYWLVPLVGVVAVVVDRWSERQHELEPLRLNA